jgi:hypothetical protein
MNITKQVLPISTLLIRANTTLLGTLFHMALDDCPSIAAQNRLIIEAMTYNRHAGLLLEDLNRELQLLLENMPS